MARAARLPRSVAAELTARLGAAPRAVAWAPGRVNLLGGHVDYQEGRVLPVAIERGVWAAARPAPLWRVVSAGLDGAATWPGGDIPPWARLFVGLVEALAASGVAVAPCSVALASDLPVGAGLSSSAASAVAFLKAASAVAGLDLEPLPLARLAQEGERRGPGVRCGLMDPLASASARSDRVALIDCRSGEVEHLALDAEVVVVPSPTQRTLAASAYEARRLACERAARAVAARHPEVRVLRDVAEEAWLEEAGLDPEALLRAQHVLREMARVERGRAALEAGDLEAFGRLMYASHASLRDRFEVSTPALDRTVAACRDAAESYGGRLTGAGFGGCTVHLVRRGQGERFRARFDGAFATRPARGARLMEV